MRNSLVFIFTCVFLTSSFASADHSVSSTPESYFSMQLESENQSSAVFGRHTGASQDHIWWVSYHFTFGSEHIKASFPTIPSLENKNGHITIKSHSKGVLYKLSGYNHSKHHLDPEAYFHKLLGKLNVYPLELEEYEIEFLDVNGLSAFNAKQVNVETGERIRSKYIVSSKNAYVMEVVYKNHHECDYERFFESITFE